MEELIDKIIDNKTRVYFISPHLDDAVLSCGELILELADKTDITVANVFTEASDGPLTLSVRAFLKQCDRDDSKKLFEERKSEDKEAFDSIGVKVKNLEFVDAQWRKKDKLNWFEKIFGRLIPELIHIYPVYRWHIINGKISKLDQAMMARIKLELLNLVGYDDNFIIFCPMAIGGNVDHLIVRECCLDIFKNNLLLWSDFPYNSKDKVDFELSADYREEFFISNHKSQKDKLLRMYKSQYQALVKDGMGELQNEKYYLKN